MDPDAAKLIKKSREVSALFDTFKKLEKKTDKPQPPTKIEDNASEIPTLSEPEPDPPPKLPTLSFASKDLPAEPKSNPFEKPTKSTFWPQKVEPDRVKVIGYIEQFYETYGSLPSLPDFERTFSANELPDCAEDWQEFLLDLQAPLAARGIRPYETPLHLLEPQFVLAVNLMCDPLDRRAPNAKLKEAGLTTKQWKNFLRQNKYHDYYEAAVNQIFDKNARVSAKQNLAKLIENGDLQAIKYYEERQNIYRPQREQNYQDLMLVMLTTTMEILAKYVQPDILQKVALEFQEREIIDVKAITANSSPVGN